MSRLKKKSVGAVGQLSDSSEQVGRRNQLMVSRLANESQESEVSQAPPPPTPRVEGGPPKPEKSAIRIKQSFLLIL